MATPALAAHHYERPSRRRTGLAVAVWTSVLAIVLSALVMATLVLAPSAPATAQTTSCAQGTQVGLLCEIVGTPPVTTIGCPVSATVELDNGNCFTVTRASLPQSPCDGPYLPNAGTGFCTVENPSADPGFACPSPGPNLDVIRFVDDISRNLIVNCSQAPDATDCPAGATPEPALAGFCRMPVSQTSTLVCDPGFRPAGSVCHRFELAAGINLSCPRGTLENTTCKIDLGWAVRVASPLGEEFCNEGVIYDSGRCFSFTRPIGYPTLDCTGSDAGTPICLSTVHYAQPGGDMLTNTPTTITYFDCPGGSGQWALRRQNNSDLVSSSVGPLTETSPGVYQATITSSTPGNIELELSVSCNGAPATPIVDYPLFTSGSTCVGLTPTLWVTAGLPMVGTSGNDVIMGTLGRDNIDAGGGDDTICGLAGHDLIIAGPGDDVVAGGNGNDVIRGNGGDDRLSGMQGNDKVFGGVGNDQLNGGGGDDYLGGFGGADVIVGGPGGDTIFGGFGADNIHGGQDDDTIRGLVGDDTIRGGDGDDMLFGDRGNDFIEGGDGNDTLAGGNANDQLAGQSGNDDVNGGRADDYLSGGDGVDRCAGNQHHQGDVADSSCETTFGIP